MHIHILGICGTFMGSLAQLAIAQGHRVTGSDSGVYPPMSDQLRQAGIELVEGYQPEDIPEGVDQVVIGNAMSRGNPSVEYVLQQGIPYLSGPEWLGRYVLQGRWVAAVAGTHGKTTTASMLAWILEYAGMEPGYLIGGVPQNFSQSARLGNSPFFVIEADEYDTAFFDKRSKFVHYRPRTVILNNLEFDHADIFPDLAAIERQFHHLLRTVPSHGQVIWPTTSKPLQRVIEQGCWSEQQQFANQAEQANADWQFRLLEQDGSVFEFFYPQSSRAQTQERIRVTWSLTGHHNVSNGIAAMMAARHVGVQPEVAAKALSEFQSVKRRMEQLTQNSTVTVFDDFAHHPTAIKSTLAGAKASLIKQSSDSRLTNGRLIAVLEPRSNTMKLGHHQDTLSQSVEDADEVFWFQPPGIEWDVQQLVDTSPVPASCYTSIEALESAILSKVAANDWVVTMSNGSFGGLPRRLAAKLDGNQ